MNRQTRFVYDKLINDQDIQSVLNIGYRNGSDPTIKNACEASGKTFTVLEVFPDNCKTMRDQGMDVIEMNVLDIHSMNRMFDAIIWLHGPEHITWDQFVLCRKDIESKANKLVIYQAPVGEYPQGVLYNNPYEQHVSILYPELFEELGYSVEHYSEFGEPTLSAWTYIGKQIDRGDCQ